MNANEIMKLENQVCSLELAKRLKELGLRQDGYFWWARFNGGKDKDREIASPWIITKNEELRELSDLWELVSAFTAAELGEMLPAFIKAFGTTLWLLIEKGNGDYSVKYESNDQMRMLNLTHGESLADPLAKMLVYLIENKLIKPKE